MRGQYKFSDIVQRYRRNTTIEYRDMAVCNMAYAEQKNCTEIKLESSNDLTKFK